MRLTVLEQKEIARGVWSLTMDAPQLSNGHEPGQFVHIQVSDSYDYLLRRPISVCQLDREAGRVEELRGAVRRTDRPGLNATRTEGEHI